MSYMEPESLCGKCRHCLDELGSLDHETKTSEWKVLCKADDKKRWRRQKLHQCKDFKK